MGGVSTIELVARMIGSLLVIGGLLLLVQRLGKNRLGGLGRGGSPTLTVTSRKQLGRGSSVALVQAGQRNFLLGVTENSIRLLAEGNDLATNPLQEADSKAVPPTRSRTKLRSRKSPPDQQRQTGQSQAELSTQLAAINRSWIPPTAEVDRYSDEPNHEPTSMARKPRRKTLRANRSAPSPIRSGTSALDALREMTVRKG